MDGVKQCTKIKEGHRTIEKKGQLSIFIIVALAIVVVIIFLFIGRNTVVNIFVADTPVNQIRTCIRDSLQEGIDLVTAQGGSIVPFNYFLYKGNKIEYLCYTEEYYEQCVMQKPLLKQSIEQELSDYIQPFVQKCLEDVKDSLEQQDYRVMYTGPEISVSLVPNSVVGEVLLDLQISKDQTEFYTQLNADVASDLYTHVITASSIANWEARYGDSETLRYMAYYPTLKVEKKKRSDGTTIYILTNRNTQESFNFAVRSIARPAGLLG
jgi:hypothetical protein